MGEPEHLTSLNLSDGTEIEFCRTDQKEVQIWHGDHCVRLPKGTGQQTLDMLALLEPFGTLEEEEDG